MGCRAEKYIHCRCVISVYSYFSKLFVFVSYTLTARFLDVDILRANILNISSSYNPPPSTVASSSRSAVVASDPVHLLAAPKVQQQCSYLAPHTQLQHIKILLQYSPNCEHLHLWTVFKNVCDSHKMFLTRAEKTFTNLSWENFL